MKWITIILAALFLCSGSLIGFKVFSDVSGENAYDRLRASAITYGRPSAQGKISAETGHVSADGTPATLPDVNEKQLAEINPAYAAWLYLPDTVVNYPVVFPDTNREYLKKTFEGKKNPCGSLFFDAGSEPLSSLNTIIHGHNMKSGKMFGQIKKFLDPQYAAGHNTIYLHVNGEWNKYRLFAVFLADNKDPFPYQTMFPSWKGFESFKSESLEKSAYNPDYDPKQAENILTLSTCHGKRDKLIIQWAEMK